MKQRTNLEKSPYAIYDTIDRWIFRVWVYGILLMHWFFLSDLPEVNGHGHLYYFWPVYAVISGILAAVEYGIVKDKL